MVGRKRNETKSIIISLRLTLKPGRDDRIIELITNAPMGKRAEIIRETLANGLKKEPHLANAESAVNELVDALEELMKQPGMKEYFLNERLQELLQ